MHTGLVWDKPNGSKVLQGVLLLVMSLVSFGIDAVIFPLFGTVRLGTFVFGSPDLPLWTSRLLRRFPLFFTVSLNRSPTLDWFLFRTIFFFFWSSFLRIFWFFHAVFDLWRPSLSFYDRLLLLFPHICPFKRGWWYLVFRALPHIRLLAVFLSFWEIAFSFILPLLIMLSI